MVTAVSIRYKGDECLGFLWNKENKVAREAHRFKLMATVADCVDHKTKKKQQKSPM